MMHCTRLRVYEPKNIRYTIFLMISNEARSTNSPTICDYSDTDYAKEFWGKGKRLYEDQVERYALQKLLPKSGHTIVDLGAGFGRLTREYVNRFSDVVLFDYAQNLLDQAKEKYSHFTHIRYIQGNLYALPFADNSIDCLVTVRVMHHVDDIPAVLKEIHRVLKSGASVVMEYANKRHVVEILRYILRRKHIQPFSHQPSRRGDKTFWNFHPSYMDEQVKLAGFRLDRMLAVSLFRSTWLKQYFGDDNLAQVEKQLQVVLAPLRISPSIFILLKKR